MKRRWHSFEARVVRGLCAGLRALSKPLPEPGAVRSRKWRDANRARYLEVVSRFYKTDHGLLKHRLQQSKRRAKLRAVKATLTVMQWQMVLDVYGHRCAYCRRDDVELTIDHVVPIAAGGEHTVENIVPACLHCNNVKNDAPLVVALARLDVNEVQFKAHRHFAKQRLGLSRVSS